MSFADEDELMAEQYIYAEDMFDRDLYRRSVDSSSSGSDSSSEDNELEDNEDDRNGNTKKMIKKKKHLKKEKRKQRRKQTRRRKHSHRSALIEILKSMRIGMDLLSFRSLPTWLLRPKSLCEVAVDMCMPIDSMYVQCDDRGFDTAEDRFIQVLRTGLFSLSTVPQQGFFGIKPYNPILGELFRCEWRHPDGSHSVCLAEQVSHHPPITALHIENKRKQYVFRCMVQPMTRFWGNSIDAAMAGGNTIELRQYGEVYYLSQPSFFGKGLLWGGARAELGNKMALHCHETGWEAVIHFHKENEVTGSLSLHGEQMYEVSGNAIETVYIRNSATSRTEVLIDSETTRRSTTKHVAPVSEQAGNESRRVWHRVTMALHRGDQDAALRHKSDIEERQRRLVREHGGSHYYTPRFFVDTGKQTVDGVPIYSLRREDQKDSVG